MRIAIIGVGAIGRYVAAKASEHGHDIAALLLRPGSNAALPPGLAAIPAVDSVAALPNDLDQVLECAGHAALRSYGPEILRKGTGLTTVSLGALADQGLHDELLQAASDGGSTLHLASGAIGALDCLRAARIGKLHSVTYTGRKPPQGWQGSPAEAKLNLAGLASGAVTHFNGNARTAATEYPKNANVAAAVALAGVGFDATRVELIADADISDNVHEIQAAGEFGSFRFEIRGRALPDNPRSSALAAMSVISSLEHQTNRITF